MLPCLTAIGTRLEGQPRMRYVFEFDGELKRKM
jgi:hypothetical protein